MTPRQFATLSGALLLLAGFVALVFPVSGDYQTALFGEQSADCGTALVSDIDRYSGEPLAVCHDELGTRRAWAWPLTAAGALVLLGAVVVRTAPSGRTEETQRP